MPQLKEICLPVQGEIDALETYIATQIKSEVPFIQKVVDYVIQNGGKRLRPILTILVAKLLGCSKKEAAHLGAAIEFMHTASILHDDVLDNASHRRKRESINKKWGNHVCVLVGDFFFCRAMDILVEHGDLTVLKEVTKAVTDTTQGEILEIIKNNDLTTSKNDYLKIIEGKTAALISVACRSGAILADVSDEFIQKMANFGYALGMAFQLMDDYLDYQASFTETGKTKGKDLIEGKLTLPLIAILPRLKDAEFQNVKEAILAEEISQKLFDQIAIIIQKHGGLEVTLDLARDYIQQAKAILASFKSSLAKDMLTQICDYVLERRS